jgi:hypothetical protein
VVNIEIQYLKSSKSEIGVVHYKEKFLAEHFYKQKQKASEASKSFQKFLEGSSEEKKWKIEVKIEVKKCTIFLAQKFKIFQAVVL